MRSKIPKALEVRLGPDLLDLIDGSKVPVVEVTDITVLPAAQAPVAVSLVLADGSRLKGRRFTSAARAAWAHGVLRGLDDSFPRTVAHQGDALLLEWVDGPTLSQLAPLSPDVAERAGQLLGRLHRASARPWQTRDPLEALDRQVTRLTAGGHLDARRTSRLREALTAHRPRDPELGVIHKDFRGENLVLHPERGPVSIDNGALDFAPLDLDLARAWLPWPLSSEARRAFARGYASHRSLSSFFARFPFWTLYALMGSAATRVRRPGTPGLKARIDAMDVLLEAFEEGTPFEQLYFEGGPPLGP